MSTPLCGVGVGLRASHYDYVLQHRPPVPWFEILADNYLNEHSAQREVLFKLRADYPMAMHSVGMSLGSTDPLNIAYLTKLKLLADALEPAYVSDHLCWVSVGETYLHELLPLPYTEAVATFVAERIRQVQDFLGRRILIENVSSYLAYQDAAMMEWDFLNLVAKRADCYILLDVNNIYVSAYNHGFEPVSYLNAVNVSRVKQFHIAGYQDHQTHLLDTHGAHVSDEVWALYSAAVKRFGEVPALIEWDNNIPDFETLFLEAKKADRVRQNEKITPITK